MEGNLRLKIDWATLIVGCKFTIFALFYFVFEGNFPISSPQGAYIWRGDLTEGFLRYRFGGFIFGGAYTWRGLFSEFCGIRYAVKNNSCHHSRGSGASHSNLDFEIFKLSLNLSLAHYSVSNEPARKPFLRKPIQIPLIYGNHCNCYF